MKRSWEMANKITKKSRNPGAVDNWLDTLGLYRKNVAYDETCLFRAVSEQLFDCQVYHERVRTECIAYARRNFKKFSHLVERDEDWQEHLNLLEKHMVVCGNIEINIISRTYKRDVIIFDAARQQITEATKRNLPQSLLLCLMDEDHYDVVYKRDHIVTAGFCQSLIYKILYEQVFNIPNVDEIVNNMLYEKNNMISQVEIMTEKKKMVPETNNNEIGLVPQEEAIESTQPISVTTNIAPFPFKVAKALDPTIYRNIEYDSWGEVRRELRLGDWYYGDDKLILGTRCILNDVGKDETYDCYIQEIIKDQNKCVVYLTKLAERRTVNYSDLSPESDAKPWPLPYRFSKNLVIAGSPQLPPIEKVSKSIKKRNKEKRRTKSCSESTPSNVATPADAVENINAYVGIPLQMHNPNNSNQHQESTETQTDPTPQETVVMTPDIQTGPNRYQWDQTHWHPYLPPTPDPFVWPQTPTTPQSMFNFNLKPMVASAPVTPDVVPYHDPNFPFYYNYHVDPYQSYGQWSQPAPEFHPSPIKSDPDKPVEDNNRTHTDTGSFQYTHDNNYEQQSTGQSHDRPTLCTTLTPQNTPVEVYSPLIPIPPGTPVIYASAPEMTEMVMPTTPIMYSPPVDMQYMSPGPYIYPPTPPAAWYPAGVNSHGFIFPQRPQ